MTLYDAVLQHYIEQTTRAMREFRLLDLLDTPRHIFAPQYWQRSVRALERLQNFLTRSEAIAHYKQP